MRGVLPSVSCTALTGQPCGVFVCTTTIACNLRGSKDALPATRSGRRHSHLIGMPARGHGPRYLQGNEWWFGGGGQDGCRQLQRRLPECGVSGCCADRAAGLPTECLGDVLHPAAAVLFPATSCQPGEVLPAGAAHPQQLHECVQLARSHIICCK